MVTPRIDDPRLPPRFWDKVVPEPNTGCWMWIGARTGRGYGHIGIGGSSRYAHSLTCSLVGPIAVGLEVDHLCRNRWCCNPEHLRATNGTRRCKTCHREGAKERRAARCAVLTASYGWPARQCVLASWSAAVTAPEVLRCTLTAWVTGSIETQRQVGRYRVDIAITSDTAQIAIEADGHAYHERTKEQAAHDRRRDRWFLAEGWLVLRFTGSEIHRDAAGCAAEVVDILVPLDQGRAG